MTKKNKMLQMIDHLENFLTGLPVGFTIESFYANAGGGVTLTLSAPTVGALKDVAPKVKSENSYYDDGINYSAAASVDNGEMSFHLNLQCVERFGEFALVFEGRTGVQAPSASLPLGTHAYLDGKHKPYGISEDTAYMFHVHPAHLSAFEEWANASGVEVLREVEREADEVA
jgi:hypothetical protein